MARTRRHEFERQGRPPRQHRAEKERESEPLWDDPEDDDWNDDSADDSRETEEPIWDDTDDVDTWDRREAFRRLLS